MNYPPATLLQAARLWEKTSAKGSKYMAGRLGGVKILILANRDYVENDPVNGHTHSLFFADGTTPAQKSHNGALRFPTKSPEPAATDVPPWEDQPPEPTAPNWRGPVRQRPEGPRRRVAGGGKSLSQLVDDVVPF